MLVRCLWGREWGEGAKPLTGSGALLEGASEYQILVPSGEPGRLAVGLVKDRLWPDPTTHRNLRLNSFIHSL